MCRWNFSRRLISMCKHRPSCPGIDEPGAENACVVAEHIELGWSMLCNGLIVTAARRPAARPIRPAPRERRPELVAA
jgi:hypothetical protein